MREWVLVRQMVPPADVDGGYVSVLQRRLHGEGEVREESLGSRLAVECKRPVFHDDEAVVRFKIKRVTRVRFLFLFFRKIALSIQHSCPIPSS